MGRKLKKTLSLILILCAVIVPVLANSITYIYGNSISSSDFEVIPKRGQVYTDGNSNLLIVKAIYDDVISFDKLISVAPYERNSVLTERSALNSISLYGGLGHSIVSYSLTTPFYPFEPLAAAGISYGKDFGVRALVMAGARANAVLANLWDTSNTFIENGKISGWGAAGISIGSSVTFAASYGFSYRHNIGFFNWELGWFWLALPSVAVKGSPYLGIGMDF